MLNYIPTLNKKLDFQLDWIVPLPNNLTLKEAMIFGTAGFTAALSIMALQENGMSTKNQPNILVTGSTGGVGSIAIVRRAKKTIKQAKI
ncbi:hypothetical protein RF262_04835 [Bacillus zhangzhouensis]|uniref:hypothetical protein n=1 Tax=Bacillus zhangzhouensis TaxID=1178540 RepID=UPI001CB979C8|nr:MULTISPECIES: hypothetical protein [Bacillus]MDR0124608.1 hypothetical protein [Bacillus zhangzhouensis]